ncbi:MAG: endonuclease I family protein [Pseudobdellovibrionaceae bacterium]
MQFVLLSIGMFVCQLALAVSPSVEKYYGADFISAYESGSLKDQSLLKSLQEIISSGHHSLGYDGARRQLFGKLYLKNVAGNYEVKDVYCEKSFTDHEVNLGPGIIPDGNLLNTEHTWPQSRFTNRFPKEVQKSDLHHLFPTDNKMNSHRGNLRFGEVVEEIENLKCPIAHLGHGESGEIVFEVPEHHKGNAARAIFYFATRYQMQISDEEEAQLRDWSEQDPVDTEEAARNEEIQKVQGNRNPYIDFPELVRKVSQF